MKSLSCTTRDLLWRSGLTLARTMVRDYCYSAQHFEDATQEVMLALWEATLSWQENLATSFDHYAWFTMRRSLFTYLTEKAEDRPILSRSERTALKSLRAHLQRGHLISSALMAVLSQETGIQPFRLQQIVGYWYAGHCAITAQVLDVDVEPLVGFDDHYSDADDQRLSAAISSLPERDRLIIAARYLEDPRVTLAELSQRLGISVERVRQLENKSLKNLRAALRAKAVTDATRHL